MKNLSKIHFLPLWNGIMFVWLGRGHWLQQWWFLGVIRNKQILCSFIDSIISVFPNFFSLWTKYNANFHLQEKVILSFFKAISDGTCDVVFIWLAFFGWYLLFIPCPCLLSIPGGIFLQSAWMLILSDALVIASKASYGWQLRWSKWALIHSYASVAVITQAPAWQVKRTG